MRMFDDGEIILWREGLQNFMYQTDPARYLNYRNITTYNFYWWYLRQEPKYPGQKCCSLNVAAISWRVESIVEKFLKPVPPDALKTHFLALPVLRLFCKIFSKYFRVWFFKNPYIHVFYDYKLVKAAKQSELKRCSKYNDKQK